MASHYTWYKIQTLCHFPQQDSTRKNTGDQYRSGFIQPKLMVLSTILHGWKVRLVTSPDSVTFCQKFFYFFLINLILNWRVVPLQNVAVFCQTSAWISHRYTCIPPFRTSLPSPPHPTPLGWYWAPVWVSRVVTQKIPVGYLFYVWSCKFPWYSLHTSHPLCMSIRLFFMSVFQSLMNSFIQQVFFERVWGVRRYIWWVCSVTQSRLTFCNLMDCSPSDSSVYGIF